MWCLASGILIGMGVMSMDPAAVAWGIIGAGAYC